MSTENPTGGATPEAGSGPTSPPPRHISAQLQRDEEIAAIKPPTGKKKAEQAKAVGQAVAKRALAKGLTKVTFDRGGYRYHGRVKALADGAREGGLEF